MKTYLTALIVGIILLSGSLVNAEDSMFIVRQVDKTPEAFIESVESYAKQKEWNFLGTMKVKNGEVMLVKFCVTEVGKRLWKQGLHTSALMPCGNIGVYQKEGKTEISLLHPNYINKLVPTPEMQEISTLAEKEIMQMLDEVSR